MQHTPMIEKSLPAGGTSSKVLNIGQFGEEEVRRDKDRKRVLARA